MLKINESYSILKGWPRIKQCVDSNLSSIQAYVFNRADLETFIVTEELRKKMIEKRVQIEQKLKSLNELGEETNNDQLKQIYNLNYMVFSDNKNPPTFYDALKMSKTNKENFEIVELEIDDYVKELLQDHLNSNILVKSRTSRTSEEPIYLIKD